MEWLFSAITLQAVCLLCVRTKSSSLCLLPDQTRNFSSVCVQQSDNLTCENGHVILMNDITYTIKGDDPSDTCGECFNGSSSQWNTTSSLFGHVLYETCSLKNGCSFDRNVEGTVGRDRLWNAVITYDCVTEGSIRDMCSSWETSIGTSGLHVTLKDDSLVRANCSCMIYGDVRSTSIIVVDYQSYMNDSVLYINKQQVLQWSHTQSDDFSVYNRPIEVSYNRTNIFISIQSSLPKMLWFNVYGATDVNVMCNRDDQLSSSTSNMSTSSQEASSTSSGTDRSTETSIFSSSISTAILPYNNEDKNSTFPILVISGTSVGFVELVVIIIVIYSICNRKRRMSNSKNLQDVHSSVSCADTGTQEHAYVNSLITKSCENEDTSHVNTSQSSPDEGKTDSEYIYLVAVDIDVDDKCTDAAKCWAHTHDSETAITKGVETSELADINIECDYTDLVKAEDDKEVYNTLYGIDTFAHTNDIQAKEIP